MGTGQSKEKPKVSPLGCVLAHWKEIIRTGDTDNKKNMIKYCTHWWPLYKLESGVKWPPNVTLDYSILLQLMFLRQDGKWDEVSYADVFLPLK